MQADKLPTVSVIIPVRNASDDLAVALELIAEQSYPTEAYEIIVVDNGSTDNTRGIAEQLESFYPDLVTVLSETNIQNSYAARNTGIRESTGEIVAFIDANVAVDWNWLETGVQTMLDLDAEYMGCKVEMDYSDQTLVSRYDAHTGIPVKRYIEEYNFAPTCSLFVRRQVFQDVGTFDERLVSGGDAVFGQQVADSGRELHYTEEVCVYHSPRSTLRSLIEEQIRTGRGLTQRDRWYSEQQTVVSVLHSSHYLPPNPHRISECIGAEWANLSLIEKAGMYAIGYVKQLSRFTGRMYESLGMIGSYERERETDWAGTAYHQDD